MPTIYGNATKHNQELIKSRNTDGEYDRATDSLETTGMEHQHVTCIFPEDTDETVTFTAGSTNNAFCSWTEVVDNNSVTLSSKFTDTAGHISSMMIEDCNTKDKAYLIELSYGDDKTIVTRQRFIAGVTAKLPAIQQIRVRSAIITAGETVYYRMKCETKDATATLSCRYHLH